MTGLILILLTAGAPALAAAPSTLDVERIGRGCCSGMSPPTLDVQSGTEVDGERIGLRLSGQDAPPSQPGWLLAGPPCGRSYDPGNGGAFLHLDPTSMLRLRAFDVDAQGSWSCRVDVHGGGLETGGVVLQAAFVDPGMSIRWALSDAVAVRVRASGNASD